MGRGDKRQTEREGGKDRGRTVAFRRPERAAFSTETGTADGGSQMDGRMDVDAWEEERERTQKIVAFGQMFDMKRKKDCRRDTLLKLRGPGDMLEECEFFVL